MVTVQPPARPTPDPATPKGLGKRADARAMAEFFHSTYERLAPEFGYRTRAESAVPWAAVPYANRMLMEAVCEEVIAEYLARDEVALTDPALFAGHREPGSGLAPAETVGE